MANLIEGLAELVLIVKDVKKSASFYRHAVGLTVEGEITDEWARFWTGEPGQSQQLVLHKGELPYEVYGAGAGERRWGPVHFSFFVAKEQLGEALARVRLQGIEVRGPQQSQDGQSALYYFYDFDGNLVAFKSPRV